VPSGRRWSPGTPQRRSCPATYAVFAIFAAEHDRYVPLLLIALPLKCAVTGSLGYTLRLNNHMGTAHGFWLQPILFSTRHPPVIAVSPGCSDIRCGHAWSSVLSYRKRTGLTLARN
jgi:hypothetical protein